LTKSDLVDRDTLELVRLEAEEFLRGSFLERAPLVAVSREPATDSSTEESIAEAASMHSSKMRQQYFRLPNGPRFCDEGIRLRMTGTLISGSVRNRR